MMDLLNDEIENGRLATEDQQPVDSVMGKAANSVKTRTKKSEGASKREGFSSEAAEINHSSAWTPSALTGA